ncbi:T9SS type A sorting domain-containing protein [Lewinella sp. IMCC34191]|uniref:T9SS type A sorting domain-containing protein n=1 Tax=Lewinella sp. IMCC34191 TaxID=2259172 RepID=UPI000E26DC34|nr:T9SS type A sorting domain-containing protein [Lewinella sp. IMCC34191]
MKNFYLAFLFLSSILSAQEGYILPRSSSSFRQDMTVTPQGDRILIGEVTLDTVIGLDLDPGPGTNRFQGVLKKDPGDGAFVASYDPQGNLNWSVLIADTTLDHSDVRAFYVDYDDESNIYVQGEFFVSADFAPGDAEYLVTPPAGMYWMTFIASYTPTGELRFVVTLPTYIPAIFADGLLRQFGVDGAGNSYSMIGYSSEFDYDPGDGESIMDGKQPVIASYDKDGNFRFAFETMGAPYVLGVSKMGDFYVGGDHRQEEYGVDLDPNPDSEYFIPETEKLISSIVLSFDTDAQLNFAQVIEGDGVYPYMLDGDKHGNLYMAGPMQPGKSDFDPGPDTVLLEVIDSFGSEADFFMAKYRRDGELVKALLLEEKPGSLALEGVQDFALSDDGELYLSGRILWDSLDLDPSEETHYISGQYPYAERAFVAGYDSSFNLLFGYTLGDSLQDGLGKDGRWFKVAPAPVCGDYVLMAEIPLPQTIDFDPREGSEYVPTAINSGTDTIGLAVITYSHDLDAGGMDCLLSGLAGRDKLSALPLRVFPNPSATGVFEMKLPFAGDNLAEYLIADLSGRIVRQGVVHNSDEPIKLDLSQQPAGVYIAKVSSAGRTAVAKLIRGAIR